MRIKKNIGFLLVILITLLRSENSRNDLFQILKNDNINHIQMTSGNIITIISGKFSPKRSDIDVRDIEIFCISIEKFLSQNSFRMQENIDQLMVLLDQLKEFLILR